MKKSCFKGCFCSKAGFTLIELLVVVLIIGILAAVAVPQYQKAVIKARVAGILTMADTYRKAVDLWILENGWPTEGDYLTGFGKPNRGLALGLPPRKKAGATDGSVDAYEDGVQVMAYANNTTATVSVFYPCYYETCGEKSCGVRFIREGTAWRWGSIKVYAKSSSGFGFNTATEDQCPKTKKIMCQYWATQGNGPNSDTAKTQCAQVGVTLN